MVAASGLADSLRDAIVEYQVGTNSQTRTPDSSLTLLTVLATDSDLQAELQIDCKSQGPGFEKTSMLIAFRRMQVRHSSTSDLHRLMARQLNCRS